MRVLYQRGWCRGIAGEGCSGPRVLRLVLVLFASRIHFIFTELLCGPGPVLGGSRGTPVFNMAMALSWWGLQLAGETDANSPVIMSCVKML